MSKYHVTGWTFTAACFGVTTVAVVCGGGTPAKAGGYDDTSKWDDFGKHYQVSNDNEHGYDHNKHGDTKVAHSDWDDKDWSEDSDDSWKHDSDYDSKHESKHDNKHDDNSKHDDRHATYASYHEDKDSGHDSEWWAAQSEWDHWAPDAWKDAGASFDDYHSQFMEYAKAFHWEGGDDNWSPDYGRGWEDNWYNWDPTDWAKAGASYEAWHSQLHAYFEHCNIDWDGDYDGDKHHDSDHEYGQTASYHEDDKDDWKDDSSDSHDWNDSESDDWKDDSSYKHSEDYSSKYDDGCDDEEEHEQHAKSDEWRGEVHDDTGHEVSYVVRQ